jgi:cell division GTPase FtsZ
MTVKNSVINLSEEEIMDDLTNKDEVSSTAESVDLDKLAQLKAKLEAKKGQEMPKTKPIEKVRSINFGVVGSGQCGSRIAESFYKLGYDSVVINTADQDLKFIDIPESNKMRLTYGLGGAAKDLEIGREAAESHKEQIVELVNNQLADAQMFIFCTSLGGGSGAGSVEPMIEVLSSVGKPIMVLCVLPMDSDDVQTKSNSLKTLEKLLGHVKTKKIQNLIVVDNAKIESIFHDVGQMNFFPIANRAIIEPIDVFNVQSAKPSPFKSLDPMEVTKLFIDGEGLSVYGSFDVENYREDTALAEAVIGNLKENLLSSGFDITQSKYVGFMLCAPKRVWDQIPASSINYANTMIDDSCGNPFGIFKGIYEVESEADCVKVYTYFSGLGLPAERLENLNKEIKTKLEVVKKKDAERSTNLNIDLGKDQVVSEAQKVKEKIAQKSSAFGKFLQQNVVDRRKG